ncbi:TRAP transporter small permease subunit [Castellaniella hirudinis]|uniref:TRAP transporter small permease subunit n=1 Tax=Castellaniella hirudinis TaxID=1144617 RepID=UPI0039C1FACC
MNALLALSRLIDSINRRVGQAVTWLILIAVLVSATNATVRKLFNVSSNAWLELQWYLFGGVFLLAAGYTLLKNEHVRVDVLASRFSRRTQVYLEIIGTVFFLLPMAALIMWHSWPFFMDAFDNLEQSSNAGGLIRWPAKLLLPIGFGLLLAAGVSHLIKCIGFLQGLCADPRDVHKGKSAEEELAEEIARQAAQRAAASHKGA